MDPFTIGLLATQGISAAVNFFTGRSQAKAATTASAQQQEGIREARAYAEPKYAEALRIAQEQHAAGQAGLAPYAQQGGQGLTALTALLGLPAAPAARAAPMAAAPVAPMAAAPPGGDMAGLVNGRGVPLSMLSQLTTKQIADANRATGGAFLGGGGTAAPATQSSYVTLRAPTGETRPVPAEQVDFYVARGATRI